LARGEEKMKNENENVAKWIIGIFAIIGLIVVFNFLTSGGDNKENYLESHGYEILEEGIYNIGEENRAYIDMKSFGNRWDQIIRGIFYLEPLYPDVDGYAIKIIEEQADCLYVIPSVILKPYLASLETETILTPVAIKNEEKIKNTINYLYWSSVVKLEYEKSLKGEAHDVTSASHYERLLTTGLDTHHLAAMISFYIGDRSRCE
jgi:hypothetical protein